jgi:Glutathione S-transferase
MSDELVFYTHPMSRGRIIRWMLEEVGQPYTTRALDWGETRKADYLAINPMGKVPAIVHGDVVVTECAAIIAYLADAFPQANLAPPPGSKLRGAYYRWLFFGAGPIEQAAGVRSLGVEPTDEQRIALGFGSMGDVLDTLEDALTGREYLVGDSFTGADLYIASHLWWGMEFGTLEKRAVFEAYTARCDARPASRRASEIDDALAAQMQPAPEPAE